MNTNDKTKTKFLPEYGSVIFVLLVFCFLLFLAPFTAEAAKLYVTPSLGSYYSQDPFTVEVRIDTEGDVINAGEGGIQFSPESAEIVGIHNANSIFSLWIEEPAFDNERGLLSFSGGTPSPGYNGVDGIITAITFRTKKNVKSFQLSFRENSRVLLDDGEGKEAVLKFVQPAYTFLEKPIEFLQISSPTHGDQTKWYNTSDVELGWGIEKRDIAFSYILDQNPETQPDKKIEGVATSVEYRNLKDGVWYFHARKFEKKRWGDPAHFRIQIDTQSPASFEPSVSRSDLVYDGKFFAIFSAKDSESGIFRYEARELKDGVWGEWKITKSPYVLLSQEGRVGVFVKAQDRAGNETIGSAEVVIPKKKLKPIVTWLIIFILSAILFVTLYRKIKYGAKI